MYSWDYKKVVGHYPDIEMMQINWDKLKWKMIRMVGGSNNFEGGKIEIINTKKY